MLYKVVIICIASAVGQLEPKRLEPQFEAENEDELLKAKLPAWLEATGYTLVEGNVPEVSEVKPDAEPEPEPVAGEAPPAKLPEKGPVAPDGTQLPTLDEYVAAGYKAEDYEGFIERRMKPVNTPPGTPVATPPSSTPPSTLPTGGTLPVDSSELGKSTEPVKTEPTNDAPSGTDADASTKPDGEAPAQS